MDWQPIIIEFLSVTSILSIIAMIRFWRQNKQLKDNEVTINNVDAQKAQIDLAEMFTQKAAEMFKDMQELQEQTYNATLKNGSDNESIINTINDIVTEQRRIYTEQSKIMEEQKRLSDEQFHIVMYLNGAYQEFLQKNGFLGK